VRRKSGLTTRGLVLELRGIEALQESESLGGRGLHEAHRVVGAALVIERGQAGPEDGLVFVRVGVGDHQRHEGTHGGSLRTRGARLRQDRLGDLIQECDLFGAEVAHTFGRRARGPVALFARGEESAPSHEGRAAEHEAHTSNGLAAVDWGSHVRRLRGSGDSARERRDPPRAQ